jgi:hypothetical protein
MATIKKIKKYQNAPGPIKPTPDSSAYYKKEVNKATKNLSATYDKPTSYSVTSAASNKLAAADKNLARQKMKGKPGYDANGFPIKQKKGGVTKKKTMKMGGKMSKKK